LTRRFLRACRALVCSLLLACCSRGGAGCPAAHSHTQRTETRLLLADGCPAAHPHTQRTETRLIWQADLTPSSACDNFLLEHRLALELEHHDADHGRLVLPILRGELAELGTLGECYGDFFKDEGVPACPEVVVDSVESKLAEHLERAGKGAVRGAPKTVKESLVKILGHQGVFVKGPRIDAVDGAVKEIVRAAYWVERTSSEVMSPTPHREHHPRERESSFDTETVAEATSLPSPFASCSTSPAPSTMPSTVPSTAPSRNVSMDLADPSREVSGGG